MAAFNANSGDGYDHKILKKQGKATKQIARETSMSRNKVKKYLHYEGEPKYQQRA